MLTLNLTPVFSLRGIDKPFTYLVQNGFTRHSANILINSKNRIFRLDHIEKLCDLLLCEPNDILTWTPNPNLQYPDNYPLSKLKLQETANIKNTFANTPYGELKKLADNIVNNKFD